MTAKSQINRLIISSDVTNRDSVLRADRIIRHDWPLVGGIVNGAMVLTDSVFSELSLEGMQAMFKPKVEGILLLHELFAEVILAGLPNSGRNPEIIAGISMADPSKQPNILWYPNPKTWDFVDYHVVIASAQASRTYSVPLLPHWSLP